MRMPPFSSLDKEQRTIYNGAPPDGSILVKGPPGTGKTIMAFHRARMLAELGQDPTLTMYNKVLKTFASAGHSHAGELKVTTVHSWLGGWCNAIGAGKEVKTGAYEYDWNALLQIALKRVQSGQHAQLHWGHLIVDEGQDLAQGMYHVLATVIGVLPTGRAPAITVFADENQRLNEATNSSIEQIANAMRLTGDGRVFELRKNYRNTRQIAEFAAAFYCGVSTGVPDIPDKKGPVPLVQFVSNVSAMVEAITNFVNMSAPMEIGVICSRDKDRKRLFRLLSEKLRGDDAPTLQTYARQDEEHGDASALAFDEDGVVTVLNYQSAKGLEFDAVFIIDPFLKAAGEGAGQQQFKMNMYVMCSRARTHLRLLFESSRDQVLPHLPKPELYKEVR